MAHATKSLRVDAHQHFWRYSPEEYGWIDDGMAAIRCDFLPGDLRPLIDAAGIDATVAVQARQSLEETEWLLALSAENDWIAGVVGWVSLIDRDVSATLERFAFNSKLSGIRHILQGEPAEYMLREDFNRGVARLREFGLVYDVLIHQHQLPAAVPFVDRHPNQQFILDHIAKPLIKAGDVEPWRTRIRDLAQRPHVFCKLSGMVTECDFSAWTEDRLRPYVETVLEAFGADRLLFGSDWPVCTVAASYTRWLAAAQKFLASLSAAEQEKIMGRNAMRVYGLKFLNDAIEEPSA